MRPVPGSLYVVATPLGNARDLTFRALDILRAVDVVAAEDTRVTASFLRRYGVSAHVLSTHAHNEARRAGEVVELLRAGKSVALVSDAGTPAISDPGARVVRAAQDAGFAVVPIPGACAVAAAVSAAGLVATGFAFLGFLPAAPKARRELLAAVSSLPLALVVYEAPHRVRATVAELADAITMPRALVIARELTKIFETVVRVPLAEAVAWLDADANRQRGEFVLIVDTAQEAGTKVAAPAAAAEAERWLAALIEELPPARAARVVAAMTGIPRETLYASALAKKERTGRRR